MTRPEFRPPFGALAGMMVGALIVLLVTLIVRTWVLVDEIRNDQQQPPDPVIELIQDCMRPGGDCYRDASSEVATGLRDLKRFTLYTVVCANRDRGLTVDVVQLCAQALQDAADLAAEDEAEANAEGSW